jgi:hypothetical protein
VFKQNINTILKLSTYKQTTKRTIIKKSVLIISHGVMVLQALADVNLTLFHTLSNKSNFTLESSHGWHQVRKCSLYIKSMRHSLGWWWCSCCWWDWWRLRNTALSLMPQLSIRLHESLYAKGIWNSWAGFQVWNIWHDLKEDLSDQTPKRQTRVLLISNLEHSVQDVLAQAKRSLHHDGL